MRYTILWVPEAEEELTRLWIDAPDRNVVTGAANEIDRRLEINPDTQGESRAADRRVLLVSPLGVIFVVKPQDRIVRVLSVWRFEKRNRER